MSLQCELLLLPQLKRTLTYINTLHHITTTNIGDYFMIIEDGNTMIYDQTDYCNHNSCSSSSSSSSSSSNLSMLEMLLGAESVDLLLLSNDSSNTLFRYYENCISPPLPSPTAACRIKRIRSLASTSSSFLSFTSGILVTGSFAKRLAENLIEGITLH